MDYREYKPPKELAHLIECFWTNTLHEDDFEEKFDLIIPDGSTEAIFMLKGSYLRKDEISHSSHLVENCSLVPPFHNAVKVYQKPNTSCLAIRFRTGAIQKLTGCCLGELNKSAYPLQNLMPNLASFTMEEAFRKVSPSSLVKKIIGFFRNQKIDGSKNFITSKFISETVKKKGTISISKFCRSFQIHKSTLDKNFKNDTGMTPKQYARLIRFNFLLNRLLFSSSTLAELSYEFGFYDQSHMTRDFKDIVGYAPAEFVKQKFSVPKLAAMSIANKHTHY